MPENATSIIDAKNIVNSISIINNKLDESKKNAENLINNINKSSESLVRAKNDNSLKRKIFKWSTETLLDLIVESNNATHSSVSSISTLIQNSNDNSKLLAEMIGKIAMLSGLSFEKLSETTTQLEEMVIKLEQNSSGNTEQADQIKRIILAHINKIKEEKTKTERIESKFEGIDNCLTQINAKSIENEKGIILIQELINSKSERHFIKVQNKQKKIIIFLFIFSIITFLTLILFIAYYFNLTY
ncbi:MAG: hypothetical protein RLZZ540_2403 [Bacteroidota bacterium]|jgi:hypothetical protein